MMQSIKGTTVYTGQEVRHNVYVNMQDAAIVSVTDTPQGEIKGEYPVLTPAFIDPHCHIGLMRYGEPESEAEVNDHIDSILPLTDALDSLQMDDAGFLESLEFGVLYSCILPGSGNILSGRSAVIRNYAKDTINAMIARAGIKAAIGYNPMSTREWKGKRPYTRMGAMGLLREKFYGVQNKVQQQKKDTEKATPLTREEEILHDILTGKEMLRVHAHKTDDIASLLRLADEMHQANPDFTINLSIEHAGDVHDRAIFDVLKQRGIPVIFGPIDSLPYKVELKHSSWRNVSELLASGVEFGLMTDHPVILQSMLLHQLRWFIRCGLSKQAAIQVLTANNAKILKVDKMLGTLEAGKWASLVCWNGDPFDMSCYPVIAYGEGQVVYRAEK